MAQNTDTDDGAIRASIVRDSARYSPIFIPKAEPPVAPDGESRPTHFTEGTFRATGDLAAD